MTDNTSLSPITVSSLASKYNVSAGKPYFPLNTLRLVYLIFMETIGTTDQTVIDRRAQDILALIPKIQAVLDARSSHRAEQTNFSLEEEWQAVQPALQNIYNVIDTPQVRELFSYVFAYVFPLQDTLLLSLYNDLANDKKFSAQDIYTIFHIRSMDSIIYSNIVGALLARDVDQNALPKDMQMSLNYKLNALYQLNDLVDAIVYAKEDLENKNFSPFELIKKTAEEPAKAREMILSIATAFERRIQTFSLGDQTEQLLIDFGHQLIGVIGGSSSVNSSSPQTQAEQPLQSTEVSNQSTLANESAVDGEVVPEQPQQPQPTPVQNVVPPTPTPPVQPVVSQSQPQPQPSVPQSQPQQSTSIFDGSQGEDNN